ncbi:MAG TPA: hypothetical protein VF599_19280 [Pyrinomonadaceae bacterium]
MTKGKNYNSIVFLTTLSVYLGLVLAGGAGVPQVMAQAALTRNFDVQIEAEIKDDLDKKPDEDLFAESIVELVRKLDALSNDEKFDWEAETNLNVKDLIFCESNNFPSYLATSKHGTSVFNRNVSGVFDESGIRIGRQLLRKKSDSGLGEFYSSLPETVNFSFWVENKSLSIEAQINLKTEAAARSFADLIAAYLSQTESLKPGSGTKIIAENTKSKADGTKVLIVTRLPRGSIDSLLAKNAN